MTKSLKHAYSLIANFTIWGYAHHLSSTNDYSFLKWISVLFLFMCIAFIGEEIEKDEKKD